MKADSSVLYQENVFLPDGSVTMKGIVKTDQMKMVAVSSQTIFNCFRKNPSIEIAGGCQTGTSSVQINPPTFLC